jgi:hypothetical protein
VVHVCNPNTQEAEARGSQVQGQPELLSETLSQKNKTKKKKRQSKERTKLKVSHYLISKYSKLY